MAEKVVLIKAEYLYLGSVETLINVVEGKITDILVAV